MTTKEPQFVIVQWLDAWGKEEDEATLDDAHESHKATPMETAGWLLRDDAKGVSVFCERYGDSPRYRGRTFIPRSMVVEVQPYKLTKPRKPKELATVQA